MLATIVTFARQSLQTTLSAMLHSCVLHEQSSVTAVFDIPALPEELL